MSNKGVKSLNIEKAALFLEVSPTAVRTWNLANILVGIKSESHGDLRFKKTDLLKLALLPGVKKEQLKCSKAYKKLGKRYGQNYDGSMSVHSQHYCKTYNKIIDAISNNPEGFLKLSPLFIQIRGELIKFSIKDGLTIEEAIGRCNVLKKEIWITLEKSGVLKKVSKQELRKFVLAIKDYCDVLVSEIAFNHHSYS